jgi:hypothetical protein
MTCRLTQVRLEARLQARFTVWLTAAILSTALLTAALTSALAQTGATQFPPGSRLGISPPQGMSPATSFPGFEDTANNAFLRLIEMPEAAFAEIEKTLSAEALAKQGMTLDKRETVKLATGEAIMLAVRQTTPAGPIRKWLMIGPLPGRTAMASFEMAETSKTYSEDAVRAAFATVTARDSVPAAEQLALLPFKLSDTAGLRPVGVIPGRAIQLTDGPRDLPDPIDQPHLVIGLAPGGPPRPDERDSFARAAFGGLPAVKDLRFTGSESMRIAGQQGHELRAEAKDAKTGEDIVIVQWLRFGTGVYVRMLGFGPKADWVKNFARFRAVRDGISPR